MAEFDADYARCRFSITCHSDDLAVVHCLRALCEFAERSVLGQIAWGGTGAEAWRAHGNRITPRFSDPAFRDAFVTAATDVLQPGLWAEVQRSDNDPAKRQRRR